MSDNEDIIKTLYFVFRIALLMSFVEWLFPWNQLEHIQKVEVRQQAKDAVVYYLKYYVFLINELENGLKPRMNNKRQKRSQHVQNLPQQICKQKCTKK